ncbi:MAG: transposase [Saprospiraceae bacterium]
MEIKLYFKKLPHILPEGALFFVTFRLEGSIPLIKLKQLKDEYELTLSQARINSRQLKDKIRCKYEKDKEVLQEQISDGPFYLKIPEIAEIVKNQLHLFDKIYYDLICYCIMPNHVHVLLDTSIQNDKSKMSLDKILKRLKGPIAVNSNRILGMTGRFWMHESYDHYIRNDKELNAINCYILNNPLKAGLVKDWRDWEYSYPKTEE